MAGAPAGVRASTLDAIGGTPLVRLSKIVPPGSADVLVKLEYFNPTGSYKDRMALAMIEGAEARGDLKPGMTVVEFTGGSTGSSLAFVCSVKGYKLKLVSSDAFSQEKLRTMQAFGADLMIVPSVGGSVTPDLFVRMREAVQEICRDEEIAFEARRVEPEELLEADEVFATTTAGGVMPVIAIDSKPVGEGRAGPITRLLQQHYWGRRAEGWHGIRVADLLAARG